jgi:hypothetical protein
MVRYRSADETTRPFLLLAIGALAVELLAAATVSRRVG